MKVLKSKSFVGIMAVLSCLLYGLQGVAQKPVRVGNVDSPNEPSININRQNAQEVLCGANLNNLYLSHDGGETWEAIKMTSDYGVHGDPVVISDSSGRYYYFHLSNPKDGNWIDRIVCQTSEDFGKTWSRGSYTGLDGTKAQDKHWAVYNKAKNEVYISWTQFDAYGSRKKEDRSNIMYSKSDDNGQSWSSAYQINQTSGNCVDSSLTTEGAVPTFSNDGTIYIAWAGPDGIRMNSFKDGAWLPVTALIDSNTAGWSYEIPGINRCNGMPIAICDRSKGENEGRIYVNWSDQRKGADDTDIFLKYSDTKGDKWSEPIPIGKRGGKRHQFLTWMAVDQTTGALYFVYYDRSRFKDNRTDVVIARSYNGGKSFKYKRIKQEPFTPVAGKFFGDYNNIDAHAGIVQLVWTRMDDADTSIWTYRFEEKKWRLKRLRKE